MKSPFSLGVAKEIPRKKTDRVETLPNPSMEPDYFMAWRIKGGLYRDVLVAFPPLHLPYENILRHLRFKFQAQLFCF